MLDCSPPALGAIASSAGSSTPMAWGESSPEAAAASSASPARLRAGGIVLRRAGRASEPEVLLVSRRRAPGSFTVPAGKFEDDVDNGSFEACALRETEEEAGIECNIMFDLGWYKGLTKDHAETRTRFFAMNFVRELPDWSEEKERVRCWKGLEEARSLMEYSSMLTEVFQNLAKDLSEGKEGSECLQRGSSSGSAGGRGMRRSTSAPSMSSDEDSDSLAKLLGLPEAETLQEPTPTAKKEEQAAPEVPPAPVEMARSRSNSLARKISFEEAAAKMKMQDDNGEEFCFYGNQVGGHFCLVKPSSDSRRILVKPCALGGKPGLAELELAAQEVVLKPFEEREHRFYTTMLSQVPAFVPHMARLFGTKTLTHRQVSAMTSQVDKIVKDSEENFLETRMRSHQFQKYIVLEDLACGLGRPCILDVKMGYKQRAKTHSDRKRERCRLKARHSTSHSLGFRLCGLSTEQKTLDKYWGRKLPLSEIRGALAEYFLPPAATEEGTRALLTGFLSHVRRLHEVITAMPTWRFWNTSLLFLFDAGDLTVPPRMRMIDFAHCTQVRGSGPDCEFLSGLSNIGTFLEALRDGHHFEGWISDRLAEPPDEAVQDAEERQSDDEAARRPSWDPAAEIGAETAAVGA